MRSPSHFRNLRWSAVVAALSVGLASTVAMAGHGGQHAPPNIRPSDTTNLRHEATGSLHECPLVQGACGSELILRSEGALPARFRVVSSSGNTPEQAPAWAELTFLFDVAPGATGNESTVDATLELQADVSGQLLAVDPGTLASFALTARVLDRTDDSHVLETTLAAATITPSYIDVKDVPVPVPGIGLVDTSVADNFALRLKRGHQYRLLIRAQVNSFGTATAFFGDPSGEVLLNRVRLHFGDDHVEEIQLVGQDVDAIHEKIDEVHEEQLVAKRHRQELALAGCDDVASLYLPGDNGGQLDELVDLMELLISDQRAAGLATGRASEYLDQAREDRAADAYHSAYRSLCQSHHHLTVAARSSAGGSSAAPTPAADDSDAPPGNGRSANRPEHPKGKLE